MLFFFINGNYEGIIYREFNIKSEHCTGILTSSRDHQKEVFDYESKIKTYNY